MEWKNFFFLLCSSKNSLDNHLLSFELKLSSFLSGFLFDDYKDLDDLNEFQALILSVFDLDLPSFRGYDGLNLTFEFKKT